jgi:hypothetical protein
MRRSRCSFIAVGVILITTACQREPTAAAPDAAPAGTANTPTAQSPANGTLRWSNAVVWSDDLNACLQS